MNIDQIWQSLQDEDGRLASSTRRVLTRSSSKAQSLSVPYICDRSKAKQKLSIIKGIRSTSFDIDALSAADISTKPAAEIPVSDSESLDLILGVEAVDQADIIATPTCYDSDDSDNEDSVVTCRNSNGCERLERLLGCLYSDDLSSRILGLTSLRDVIKALAELCPKLPQLDFLPPFDESRVEVERNLPLVSDLAKSMPWTDVGLTQSISDQTAEEKHSDTSNSSKDNLQAIMDTFARKLFQLIGDKSEKCRSLSLRCLELLLLSGNDTAKHIPYLLPVLVARYPASSYDNDLNVFVADDNQHEFYKRGGAIDRQDRDGLLSHRSSFQLIEPNEELRLALCNTFSSLIRGLVARNALPLLDAYYSDIILALQTNLKDPFPDVKIATCQLLVQILRIPQWERGAKHFATGLARAALPNMRHRKTQVIVASIDLFEACVCVPDRAKAKGAGTSAIADLVGFREENVLPIAAFYDSSCAVSVNTLAELASHKNPRVRLRCCEMLCNFLVYLPDKYDHQQRLLPYVLSFVNDTSLEVQRAALECIEKCGWQYEQEHPDDVIERLQLGIDGDDTIDYNNGLPSPFTSRPGLGARLFVRSNTSRFYLAILGELSNWKAQTRKRSADLLLILTVYCEEHLTKDFQHTINAIAKAIEIETKAESESAHLQILDTICQVVRLMSKYIDPAAYIPLVSPRILGDSSSSTSYADDGSHSEKSRHSHVIILSSLIQGAPLHRLVPYWQKMVSLLENCIGVYVGSTIQSSALNALSNLTDKILCKNDMNVLITYLRETGRVSETRSALVACQDILLQDDNPASKECANKISQIVCCVNQN